MLKVAFEAEADDSPDHWHLRATRREDYSTALAEALLSAGGR